MISYSAMGLRQTVLLPVTRVTRTGYANGHRQMRVLRFLTQAAEEAEIVGPSLGDICRETNLDEDEVRQVIKELAELGDLVVQREERQTRYTIPATGKSTGWRKKGSKRAPMATDSVYGLIVQYAGTGTRMPCREEAMEKMTVSRSSYDNALAALVHRGLIEVVRGPATARWFRVVATGLWAAGGAAKTLIPPS